MRQGLRRLAEVVERIEAAGDVVEDATVSRDGDDFAATLTLRLADGPENAESEEGIEEGFRGGGVRTAQSRTAETGPLATADVGARAVDVGETLAGEFEADLPDAPGIEATEDAPGGEEGSSDDEPVPCRVEGCAETFETEHGMKIHATKAHKAADGSAPSPHRDPERLQAVYAEYDTFAEMTEALDADVTPQTVRRSMVSLGVHDPDGDDADPGDGEAVADGEAIPDGEGTGDAHHGQDGGPEPVPDESPGPEERVSLDEVDDLLPEAVEGEAFVGAVEEASTIHEVKRSLGMEREAVQTLLAELDLLDLVHGRVATEDERDAERAEIERRIVERAG